MDWFLNLLNTLLIFGGALMLLVFVHELGHFLAAKLFGMRVERFSIGFPPRVWGFQKGETDYCIGATPLGGYVKISGMIDESLDTDHLEKEPEPWEFRSKPVWQRIITITAGVIFNMILAVMIYFGMTYTQGKAVLPIEETEGIYVPETSLLHEVGFQTGDKIVGVNGERATYFNDLVSLSNLTSDNLNYTVIRDGNEVNIPVSPNYLDSLKTRGFISPEYTYPSTISSVQAGSPAASAGLEAGDKFISANGNSVKYWVQLVDIIQNAEGAIDFGIQRGDSVFYTSIAPDPETQTVGIVSPTLDMAGATRIDYGLFESISEGYHETVDRTVGTVQAFARMFSGDISVTQNLGGPIAIANMTREATDRAGWIGFWNITALLSITLAILNILPIPALDGGHLVFLIYEGITRREPSEKVRMVAQQIGFFIMIAIFIFVMFNDAFRYF
ncbi:RIP metalloprotease RseP [Gracilimonas mengyeensis]|uniref:Zinc metalloprotease n=1 Tax=Gracilimonas mengyeensis TaxID=1302730 RepID=A0A521ALZ9_9BACT|nr:RIP metalloprotease RseP [Gracilimonas mengyeensis]SMO35826.1 site-2 protease. Metallo peptidase. MEROPS family M50B [Gracilimonas mengyeensis]